MNLETAQVLAEKFATILHVKKPLIKIVGVDSRCRPRTAHIHTGRPKGRHHRYKRGTICIRGKHLENRPDPEVIETLKHEVAHLRLRHRHTHRNRLFVAAYRKLAADSD